MRENKYVIRIFDGTETWIYNTKDTDIHRAENKILDYHTALGRNTVRVTTTQQRG